MVAVRVHFALTETLLTKLKKKMISVDLEKCSISD